MKNKNILILFLLALPMVLFNSCLKDQEDVFDESASVRMQKVLTETKAVLRGAENGWVMDYFVGDNQEYGGVPFLVKFDSLTCTASSMATPTPVTSYYKLTTDQGPVLTFDTYSEVLHALAKPANGLYEGYHADFEFVIMSATPEKVVLKGKKTGSYMTLRPLEMATQKEYVDKAQRIADSLICSTAHGKIGETTVNAEVDLDNYQITFTTPSDTAYEETCAYTTTDKGIRLYKTIDIAGKKVSEFSFNIKDTLFSCIDGGSSDFVMKGVVSDEYVHYEDYPGDYTLTYNATGSTPSTVSVTLTPTDDKKGFTMSGLNKKYTVNIGYKKSSGALTMNTQYVGEYKGQYVYFNAVTSKGNFFSGATETGMITKWNKNKEHPVYNWITNGSDLMNSAGFFLCLFNSEGEYVDGLDDSGWNVTGSSSTALLDLKSLTKK